jgi:hypothetical protein
MIVQKNWERMRADRFGPRSYAWRGTGKVIPQYHDTYVGWFLFGLIPLFIIRSTEPLVPIQR